MRAWIVQMATGKGGVWLTLNPRVGDLLLGSIAGEEGEGRCALMPVLLVQQEAVRTLGDQLGVIEPGRFEVLSAAAESEDDRLSLAEMWRRLRADELAESPCYEHGRVGVVLRRLSREEYAARYEGRWWVDSGLGPQLEPWSQDLRGGAVSDADRDAAAATTDEQIDALRTEAGQAGDREQVALCDRALDGDEAARAECARVIDEAARAAAVQS